MAFSLNVVFGDTWLVHDKCLGEKFCESYSDTPIYERVIPHVFTQLNRILCDELKKEVGEKSVHNIEISDVIMVSRFDS